MNVHPAANIFPMMSEAEFQSLKADIAAHGVREPVWVTKKHVLDGRNRARACDEIGIEVPTLEYEGDDPVGFVVSLNLKRRHLSESQRAVVAAKAANLPAGVNQHRGPADLPDLTQAEAAKVFNTSERAIRQAKRVEREAPELFDQVFNGEMALDRAEAEIKRAQRAAEIARQVEALAEETPSAPMGLFHVISIDPPWRYDFAPT